MRVAIDGTKVIIKFMGISTGLGYVVSTKIYPHKHIFRLFLN